MAIFAPTHLCRNCGNQVRPSVSSKVNGCFLIVLLFFFLVPGILYLVWAGTQRIYSCPKCGLQDTLIPLGAPEAQRLLSQKAIELSDGRAERACPWCAEPILVAAKVCKHCGREV